MFYNDDSSDVHCLPLVKNALKWSEGFMGDCMMIFAECRCEEPIRSIALDMDFPKVAIFERNGFYYDSVAYPTYDSLDERLRERNYNFNSFSSSSLVSTKVNWCLNSTICSDTPSYIDSSKSTRKCSDRVDWNCKKQNVTWRDVSMQEWSFDDNLKITMKNGEVLSIFGVLGACNQNRLTNDIVLNARRIVSRLLENKCATSDVLVVHNVIKHHTGEIVLH